MQELTSPTIHYASYLLRLRWSQKKTGGGCQIMLINVTTREQYYFDDLARLFAYLAEQRDAEKGGKSAI